MESLKKNVPLVNRSWIHVLTDSEDAEKCVVGTWQQDFESAFCACFLWTFMEMYPLLGLSFIEPMMG